MSSRNGKDLDALIEDGSAVDRAVVEAFAAAVLRHRQAGVPMVFSRDGKPVHVSPFDIRLPGEDDPPSDGDP